MAYPPRHPIPSHIRPSSGPSSTTHHAHGHGNSTQSSSIIEKRILEKKVELESLRQLRDLSAGLAGQMEQLEQKLGTLSSGTEAVAEVLGNWNYVLRAIFMASAKIPKPKDRDGEGDGDGEGQDETPLPQTLVRIPIQQAEAAQREQDAAAESVAGAGG